LKVVQLQDFSTFSIFTGADVVFFTTNTVVIPALGCATQGDSIDEARANAVEAAEGWLTSQHKRMKDEAIRATQE
jgi:hypothetical protein